jgi:hypothetical protein
MVLVRGAPICADRIRICELGVHPLPLPKGAFEFFLFFGLSMILLQITAGLTGLGVEAYVPKILLVARAHSVSPSVIMQRVLARR